MAYTTEQLIKNLCDDNMDILIENGWYYKPFILTKHYKACKAIHPTVKQAWYEFEIVPPNELLN